MNEAIVLPAGEHHELGPSQADRYLNCPGSVEASRGAPNEETTYAAEGTVAHYLSEIMRKRLIEHGVTDISETLGQIYQTGSLKVKVDDEMVASVRDYVNVCVKVPGKAFIEARVKLDPYAPGAFGTLDDGRVSKNQIVLTEFKHGMGVKVEAKMNPQLLLQALGLWEGLKQTPAPLNYESPSNVKVILRVSQPRLDHFDEWVTDMGTILYWAANTYRPTVIAIENGSAKGKFKAGDWCHFCRIRFSCAERAKLTQLVPEQEFDDAFVSPVALTQAQTMAILPKLHSLEAWIKSFKIHVRQEAAAGRLPGYKVVEGKAARTFKVSEEEVVATLELEGYTRDQLYTQPELKSAPQIMEIVGKNNEIVPLIIQKGRGKPTLVPVSDKRPAIVDQLISEFDDTDED